jgi:hypothetical protein
MQMMSPRDIAALECSKLLIWSIGKGLAEKAEWSERYVPPPIVRSNYKLLDDKFELRYRKIDPKTGSVVEEGTTASLRNPLVNVVNVRGARKQVAARAYRKIESMDDRQLVVVKDGVVYDLGRNCSEASSASFLQDVRVTNFSAGAKYAGGQVEVRRAAKARVEEDERPVAKVTTDKGEDPLVAQLKRLEQKVRELMGMRK